MTSEVNNKDGAHDVIQNKRTYQWRSFKVTQTNKHTHTQGNRTRLELVIKLENPLNTHIHTKLLRVNLHYVYVNCVCMYVCIYICTHVSTYVCIYVCMYVYVNVFIYVCVYLHVYVCVYVCMYVCMYVNLSIHTMYVYHSL